ncbi:MAG: hypothetical protein H0V89_10115 [Deltaproteobacteria bacterium]|nr:hypothetical protein [Deltaproteobacteria bacterium]
MIVAWLAALSFGQESAVEGAEKEEEEGGVSTTFTEDFEIRYWRLPDRLPDPSDVAVFDYIEQVNRLNANARSGRWGVDVQIDEVALFMNRYYLDGELYTERELVAEGTYNPMPGFSYVNPEKMRVTWEGEHTSLVVGDAYAAFGRGVALNLNRNVDIDIDTSIQGFKGLFRPGAWDVTLLVGQLNRQQVQQDNPNAGVPGITGDLRHLVGGIRAERFGLGPANVGAHAVAYKFVERPGLSRGFAQIDDATPLAAVAGVTTELTSVAGFDWYGEVDVFGYQDMPNPLPDSRNKAPGYGAYLSAATYPGPFVLLVEGKRYLQADRLNAALAGEFYEVATGPTLEYERAVNEDSSAALNSNDITGGRLQLDWSAMPGKLTPYAAMAVFRDEDLGGLHFNRTPETITHPMIGVEYVGNHRAVIGNFGVRTDDRDAGAPPLPVAVVGVEPSAHCGGGARPDRDRQMHGDLTVEVPIGPLSLDVALAAELYCWGVNEFQQTDYVESETSYTLSYGSDLALTWFMDYTTNPLVNSTGNLGDERLYGAVEVQVKPADAFTLKAFYGAYKAGIRCSGGQCRQLPGFSGARVSAVGTF